MALTEYHGYRDSVRWRVVSDGVQIEDTGIERTSGTPSTVTSVWHKYAAAINDAAARHDVPCHLILATICTESRGNPRALRVESGHVSDEQSPHRVSVGIMQTLISTARAVLGRTVDREWLFVAENSIEAGTPSPIRVSTSMVSLRTSTGPDS